MRRIVRHHRSYQSDEMPPELRRRVPALRAWLDASRNGNLVAAHALGGEVRRLLEDEVAFGAHPVQDAATALGVDPRELYAFRDVAVTITAAEVKAIAARRLAAGARFGPAHLIVLARVKVKAERCRLVDRALAEGWTVEQLVDAITPPRPRPARNPRPVPVGKGLDQVRRQVTGLIGKLDVWESTVVRELAARPASQVDESLLARTRDALDAVAELEFRLPDLIAGLGRGVERLRRVLDLRATHSADPAAGPGRGHPTKSSPPLNGEEDQ